MKYYINKNAATIEEVNEAIEKYDKILFERNGNTTILNIRELREKEMKQELRELEEKELIQELQEVKEKGKNIRLKEGVDYNTVEHYYNQFKVEFLEKIKSGEFIGK